MHTMRIYVYVVISLRPCCRTRTGVPSALLLDECTIIRLIPILYVSMNSASCCDNSHSALSTSQKSVHCQRVTPLKERKGASLCCHSDLLSLSLFISSKDARDGGAIARCRRDCFASRMSCGILYPRCLLRCHVDYYLILKFTDALDTS
jgi:hypothetical protein